MTTPLRIHRAEPDQAVVLDSFIASLVKGMLLRGDRQSDIAACFRINSGRIAEINSGQIYDKVDPAPADHLPPAGPYPSPYELHKTKHELWRVRVALEEAEESIRRAILAVHKAEQRSI